MPCPLRATISATWQDHNLQNNFGGRNKLPLSWFSDLLLFIRGMNLELKGTPGINIMEMVVVLMEVCKSTDYQVVSNKG